MLFPQKYQIQNIPDLPRDGAVKYIHQLFKQWPHWIPAEEDYLTLSDAELSFLHDENYGSDIRWLKI